LRAIVSITALALLLWLFYGAGYVGYDGMYALVWGRDLAHLELPDFEGRGYPTPHPLLNLLTAALSPLGRAEADVLLAISIVSLALLGWAAYRFGAVLYGTLTGLVFAAILLTRPVLVEYSLYAAIDVPFLALVLMAAGLAVRQPRRDRSVLALLLVAGLLRPEGWLLALVYAGWVWPDTRDRRGRVVIAGLVLAAPLVWLAFDFVVTGDPLHSLHGTSEAAERIGRPRGFDTSLRAGPGFLEFILSEPIAWGGLGGCLLGLFAFYRRSLVPLALLALGLGGFVVLGVFSLPLLPRYLLVPSAMLALFCAVVLVGWRDVEPGRARVGWIAAAVILAAALALSVPDDRERLLTVDRATDARRSLESSLLDVVDDPAAREPLERCSPVSVAGFRLVPLVAWWRERDLHDVLDPYDGRRAGSDVYVTVSGPAVGRSYLLQQGEERGALRPLPPGLRRRAANGTWAVHARCP
jgi:hypothetical protein